MKDESYLISLTDEEYDNERLERKQKVKDEYLKYRFNISLDEYQEMLENQNGVCAICEQPETAKNHRIKGTVKMLAVDHCHETGKIRGLLCTRCNTLLGLAKDSREILSNAQAYLFINR